MKARALFHDKCLLADGSIVGMIIGLVPEDLFAGFLDDIETPKGKGPGPAFASLKQRYRNMYDSRVKTTLDLNDRLLAEAKALAARQHTTLTRLVEEGLRLRLQAQQASAPARAPLPVYAGKGGLVAGIDPKSNKSLLQAADDDA